MAERQDPPENNAADQEEVKTNHHLHQGLGVGARELASIGESGEKGTLEQDLDEDGKPRGKTTEVGGDGRAASVLDRKDEEQLSPTSDA
jgi:hypothetical protein